MTCRSRNRLRQVVPSSAIDRDSRIGHIEVMARPRVILIAGPTASGKSALALELARRHDGVIVNADSMQVYRELRILTARPGDADLAAAEHRLYGHVSASVRYSVGQWLEDVTGVLADREGKAGPVIIVGGTGLYFKALTEGLAPVPEIPADLRRRWRERAAALGSAGLYAELAARDPVMAGRLSPTDPQRLVRAIEVIEATGRSLADWQRDRAPALVGAASCARYVVAPLRKEIYDRTDARFERMIASGALEEVAQLAHMQLDTDLPVMRALGVAPLMAHCRGTISLSEAGDRARTDTRRYAKRQLTWLRGNMISWNWLGAQDYESFKASSFAFIDL